MISHLGSIFAILGSLISIYGALINNLTLDHKQAMQAWMYSNILLLVWAGGFCAGIWDGGLSGAALVAMYAVFTASNWYGLKRMQTG